MSTAKKTVFKFSFFALLFMALMVAWLGFGKRGFIYLYRMEKERRGSLERIRKLEGENQRLFDEIHRLRTDKEYIESMARKELGLVKRDEMLFRFSGKGDGGK